LLDLNPEQTKSGRPTLKYVDLSVESKKIRLKDLQSKLQNIVNDFFIHEEIENELQVAANSILLNGVIISAY
jgi:hypothetical protein